MHPSQGAFGGVSWTCLSAHHSAFFNDPIQDDGVGHTNNEKKRSAYCSAYDTLVSGSIAQGIKLVHTNDAPHTTYIIQFVVDIRTDGNSYILNYPISDLHTQVSGDVDTPRP